MTSATKAPATSATVKKKNPAAINRIATRPYNALAAQDERPEISQGMPDLSCMFINAGRGWINLSDR